MRIRDGVPFGTIAGFPLYLATSFPLGVIFGAGWALRASHTGEMVERLFIVLFAIASVLAHELAHASAARSLGFPVRHIALTGYGGYAEFWFNASSRWRECAIAFVGPAANLRRHNCAGHEPTKFAPRGNWRISRRRRVVGKIYASLRLILDQIERIEQRALAAALVVV